AYWSLLGGASGHFYGGGGSSPLWDFPSGWQNALDSPGSMSMFYFGRLLRSRRWDLLVPDYDHTVLTAGYGDINGADYAPAARTSDGQTVIIYAPTQRTLSVAMDKISGTAAMGWWFDPSGGTGTFLGVYPTTGTHDFTPPSNDDWVLVLDDEAAGLGAPGQRVPVASDTVGKLKSPYH
ncbi:MAG: putative collagen-binding domain-containing protein, partial [Terriglobia bacterium]